MIKELKSYFLKRAVKPKLNVKITKSKIRKRRNTFRAKRGSLIELDSERNRFLKNLWETLDTQNKMKNENKINESKSNLCQKDLFHSEKNNFGKINEIFLFLEEFEGRKNQEKSSYNLQKIKLARKIVHKYFLYLLKSKF